MALPDLLRLQVAVGTAGWSRMIGGLSGVSPLTPHDEKHVRDVRQMLEATP